MDDFDSKSHELSDRVIKKAPPSNAERSFLIYDGETDSSVPVSVNIEETLDNQDLEFFFDDKVRKAWHKQEEEWYFSIVDVCQVLTDSADGRKYWNKLNIQSIPSKKAEPFKLWLAQVGKERLDEIADPELALNQLAEVSATALSQAKNPKGFQESRSVTQEGGTIAGNARRELEEKLGKSVISPLNADNPALLDDPE